MDSFTQVILGASVGEAILGKKIGRRAALWGAIAGTIPDLDVFSNRFLGYVDAMAFHRGFSHSILFAFLCACMLAFILNKVYQKKLNTRFIEWFGLFFWGLFTHALLDCHTTWGTQLFWPSEIRIALSNIFVVDPLYTLPFFLLLGIALFLKKESPVRRRLNYAGLIISSSYLILSYGIKQTVVKKFESYLEEQQIEYTGINIRPTPLNTILWTANVETEKSFLIGQYSLLDQKTEIEFRSYPKKHFLLNKYAENNELQKLMKIMEGNFIVQHKGKDLLISDLRFGQMFYSNNEPGPFVFNSLLIIENNEIIAIEDAADRDGERIQEALEALFTRLQGI